MRETLKILLLEDCLDDVVLVERELGKAGIIFTALVVKTRNQFEKALKEFNPDVVLADHSLPQFNSIEAFEIFQQYQKDFDLIIPFILVTGEVSEGFAVQCLKAGVDDYILKERLKRLGPSIESALDKCRIERERRKYFNQILAKEALMNKAEHLANFGSWQADLITGKHTWSDETYYIYGYKPGEIEPDFDAYFSLVHPDDKASIKKLQDFAMENLDGDQYEFRIIDFQGKLKYISSKLQIYRDASRRPIRLVGFNLDITERKRTEIALQKSEQEYRSLFDQNPDVVFSLDLFGRFTNVNKGLTDMVGGSADDLRGRDFLTLVLPEERARVNQHFLSALERKPQRYEATFIDKDGKTITYDVTVMAIVVNDKVIGVHGVSKDITEKRELENLLDQAYRQARIGGWELDLEIQKLSWTSITRELLEVAPDFTPEVESGIHFYKEGPGRQAIREALENCIQNGIPWDLELQIITAKGNERWVRCMGEAEIKHGKCVSVYGTFQDIHKRKEAEEALKIVYEEKANILESIGDAFFAVDKNWTVTYWNNIAESQLRMPRNLVLGKNLWQVSADAIPLACYKQYLKAMNENVAVHFEEFYPSLNIWVEVNAYPSSYGLSVYFKNITDQKKRLCEIENQNNQLKEIARIQSHEVRAPLARIMGLVNLINDGLNCETELPSLLADIGNSACELDKLVRKIVKTTEELDYMKLFRMQNGRELS